MYRRPAPIAKLMDGGCTCLQVLGAKRKHLSGYSAATQGLHEGFIFGSEIIQVMPLQSGHVCTMQTQDAMCMVSCPLHAGLH